MVLEVRMLDEEDDCSSFLSGHAKLDEFFRRIAKQDMFRRAVSATHVAAEGTRIVGYCTLSGAAVTASELPVNANRFPRHPVPVLRLARMAVARDVQSGGIGKSLLRFAIQRFIAWSDAGGGVGMVVDAKHDEDTDAVGFYKKFGFQEFQMQNPPPGTVSLFLAAKDIRASQAAASRGTSEHAGASVRVLEPSTRPFAPLPGGPARSGGDRTGAEPEEN